MTLLFCQRFGMKRNGPQAAPTANGPSIIASVQGDAPMPVNGIYTDSESEINIKSTPQWKAIGDVARALVHEMAERRASK